MRTELWTVERDRDKMELLYETVATGKTVGCWWVLGDALDVGLLWLAMGRRKKGATGTSTGTVRGENRNLLWQPTSYRKRGGEREDVG